MMSVEKNALGLVDASRQEIRAAAIRMDALHKAPMGLTDLLRVGAGRKTKDFIGLLLGHGARTRRASCPRALVRLRVFTPAGKPAVQVCFQ